MRYKVTLGSAVGGQLGYGYAETVEQAADMAVDLIREAGLLQDGDKIEVREVD